MRDENKHYSDSMNMNMGMGMGVSSNPSMNPSHGSNMNGLNMNPSLSGMNVINPTINPNFSVGPSMNSHINPNTSNPSLNVIQKISLLIKSQLPYLQTIMMNVKAQKKEERNQSR